MQSSETETSSRLREDSDKITVWEATRGAQRLGLAVMAAGLLVLGGQLYLLLQNQHALIWLALSACLAMYGMHLAFVEEHLIFDRRAELIYVRRPFRATMRIPFAAVREVGFSSRDGLRLKLEQGRELFLGKGEEMREPAPRVAAILGASLTLEQEDDRAKDQAMDGTLNQ